MRKVTEHSIIAAIVVAGMFVALNAVYFTIWGMMEYFSFLNKYFPM